MHPWTVLVVGPFDSWGELLAPAFFGVLLGVGIVGVVSALRQFRRSATVVRSDPVDAGSVYLEEGAVELEGEVEGVEGERCTTRYTDRPCVVHEYEKEKRERRRDADGDRRTTYRTLESGSEHVPFYVRDDTGRVLVDPADAALSLDRERISGGRIRKYEGLLQEGDVVHVYGQKHDALETDEVLHDEDTYVGDGDAVADFMVSDTTEERTALRYGLSGAGRLLLFAAWTAVAGFLTLQALADGAFESELGPVVDGIVEFVRTHRP